MPNLEHVAPPNPVLRFGAGGRFELRTAEYRLLVDGAPAALGGRALDLLMALATRPSQLLSKNMLFELVWPGVVVEENNLRVQINALRRLLGNDAITTVPGRGYRFTASVQADAGAAATGTATAAVPSAAPPVPPLLAQRLFGRDEDLAELEHLLRQRDGGCITLVGPAGVGKSSLAGAATARQATGAVWVDLAPLTHGGQVAGALARALGVSLTDAAPAPQLQRATRQRADLLLVLDNAEHVVEAVGELAAALSGIAPLQLLVTSQLPLAVRGERVQRLEPLQLPGNDAATADAAQGAMALLVDRITAADRRFKATPEALPLLAALCVQLDGLPLALEMAAARVPMMGLQAVHAALRQRFSLLTRSPRDAPARHRTLHDALDWSYRLLGAAEQRLLTALGLFAGGFTLELALALAADSEPERWEVLDRLATLVDRSLVQVDSGDPPRYRLLRSVHDFAREQLEASADGQALRHRHASAVLAFFAGGPPEAACMAEMENAREAFAWARLHDIGMAAALSARAAAASVFTVWRQESTNWMLSVEPAMRAQAQGGASEALPLAVQADWWSTLARMLSQRQHPAALAAARQGVALWRGLARPREHQAALAQWVRAIADPGPELDQACTELQQVTATFDATPRELLRLHGALGRAAETREDVAAVLACRLQEVALAREMNWPAMMHAAESNVCLVLTALGRHAEAAERGRLLLQRVDADQGDGDGNLPWVLNSLIGALIETGELAQAQALAARAVVACRRFSTGAAWPKLILLAAAQRRFRAAAQLIGHVRQLYPHMGWTLEKDEEAMLQRVQQAAVDALGAAPADALTLRGALLNDAQSLALASGAMD